MKEQLREKGEHDTRLTGWEAWDDVPDDGPAVFVLDTDALDHEQRIHGAWLHVDQGPQQFGAALTELLGRAPTQDNWAAIDQVGLGDTMVPEHFQLSDLPTVLDEVARDRP